MEKPNPYAFSSEEQIILELFSRLRFIALAWVPSLLAYVVFLNKQMPSPEVRATAVFVMCVLVLSVLAEARRYFSGEKVRWKLLTLEMIVAASSVLLIAANPEHGMGSHVQELTVYLLCAVIVVAIVRPVSLYQLWSSRRAQAHTGADHE